ncbi:uncharacterized protein LOC6568553 [Drosophila grimshawi]|uniref:uncharacterized protein LOC6568553 n=1 Tax=Drosophila grimshawi TaxID=7222 RepID=UPI000C870ABA|nr:uncharacterized protein LOC6568553 [Drosophila grimshawi]
MAYSIVSLGMQYMALVLFSFMFSSGFAQNNFGNPVGDPISYKSACNCTNALRCTCCLNAIFKIKDTPKMLCTVYDLSEIRPSVDVELAINNKTILTFTLNRQSSRTFCLPVISKTTPMAMCIKNSEMQLESANRMCPSFHSIYSENQLLAFDFPCFKLLSNSISIV